MIIQCEQCQTKFRLDDSKVKETGVRVRCARCRHVFPVMKEQQETFPQPELGAQFDQGASLLDEAQPLDSFTTGADKSPGFADQEYDFDDTSYGEDEQEEESPGVDPSMFDLPEEEAPPIAELGPEFSNYDPEDDLNAEAAADQPPVQESGIDFGGFSFGDLPEHADSNAEGASGLPDMSDSYDASAPADFQLSDFADSDEIEEDTSEAAIDQPFSLGEIDFGDDLAAISSQQVNPDESKPLDFDFGHFDTPLESPSSYASSGAAPWIAPAAAAAAAAAVPLTAAALAQQPHEPRESSELTSDKIGMWGPWVLAGPEKTGLAALADELEADPALVAKNKQSHMLTYLLSIVAFFGMVIGIYTSNTRPQEDVAAPAPAAQAGQPVQPVQPGQAAPAAGKITLSGVDAAFVNNKKTGELLVITGNAVNNFDTPRAALQIKGMVYGENGQVVASKTAYCGNTLTKEQLATMPMETIEAAMANQFGSSLDNQEVAPGKVLPCMVVISKLPGDAKDYGALAAGSLPAAPKQNKAALPPKAAK